MSGGGGDFIGVGVSGKNCYWGRYVGVGMSKVVG